MTNQNDNAHAIGNAQAWLETIQALTASLDLDFDNPEDDPEFMATLKACECDNATSREDIADRIDNIPLSIETRPGWTLAGNEPDPTPEEYKITLSTGGPACRIIGELRQGEPSTARLEWQDWYTPWTEYQTTTDEDAALLAFASCFYFGE